MIKTYVNAREWDNIKRDIELIRATIDAQESVISTMGKALSDFGVYMTKTQLDLKDEFHKHKNSPNHPYDL